MPISLGGSGRHRKVCGIRRAETLFPDREAIFIATWTRSSLKYILTGDGSLDDH